jgi:hypothetical protein
MCVGVVACMPYMYIYLPIILCLYVQIVAERMEYMISRVEKLIWAEEEMEKERIRQEEERLKKLREVRSI